VASGWWFVAPAPIDDILVDGHLFSCHLFATVSGSDRCAAPKKQACPITQMCDARRCSDHRVSQRARRIWLHHPPAFSNEQRGITDISGDHRCANTHGLEHNVRAGLAQRRHHANIGSRKPWSRIALLARVIYQRRSLQRNVHAALTSLPSGLPDTDEYCAFAQLGPDDLRGLYETPNPFIGVRSCDVRKDDRVGSDSNSGANGFSPLSHVPFIRDIDSVMSNRGALHAKAHASVLRARKLRIEHDGPWIRRRCARTSESELHRHRLRS